MANYNGEPFLQEAIQSILTQSCEDFEFIVVDDGSTDDGYAYLMGLSDPRLVLIPNEKNRGQTPSLNTGLRRAKGEFIARMDSDDVSMPDRLQRQVAFLRQHDEVDILGTQAVIMDTGGRRLDRTRLPETSDSIWAYSIVQSPFVHPSVMMRSSLVHRDEFWFDEDTVNQDFDLWSRMLPTRRGANLSEPLVRYRVHGENMTIRQSETILQNTIRIVERRLKVEGLNDWLSRDDIAQIWRYLLADRRLADREGVDRLDIARKYWTFCRRLSLERETGRQFLPLIARRIIQSGVWPNGMDRLPERVALLLELVLTAPIDVMRLLADIPAFMANRIAR